MSKVNKKTLESLIKAGALDKFGKRASMLISFPEFLEEMHRKKKNKDQGQTSLFEEEEMEIKTISSDASLIEDFSEPEKLAFEKEFLGIYLSSHPHLETLEFIRLKTTHEIQVLAEEREGTRVKVGGIIESSRKILTKKTGSEMAFLVLGDEKGLSIECVVFPKVYDLYKRYLIRDTVILVEGKVDARNDRPMIIVESVSSAKQKN